MKKVSVTTLRAGNKLFIAFALYMLLHGHVVAQYCNPTIAIGCSSDHIRSFSTSGGIDNIINIGSGCASASGLSSYLSMTHSTVPGGTVGFTVVNCPSFAEGYMMWVDFNFDGDFDDFGENVWAPGIIQPGASASGSFTVPTTALTGITRLRIACAFNDPTAFGPCARYNFGEVEDYSFNISAPCSGFPNFYTVNAPSPVCSGKEFKIGLNGAYYTGLNYQWSYSDDAGRSWKPYTGAVNAFGVITDAITKERSYRCYITCGNSGLSYMTLPHTVKIAPFYYCYCDNSANTALGLDIGNVSLYALPQDIQTFTNGLSLPIFSNNTAKNTYSTFQYAAKPLVMYRDSSFRIVVKAITSGASINANAAVFIDLDRDGIYGPGEKVMSKVIDPASVIPYTESATFTVPAAAKIGLTGMRVILSAGTIDSCGMNAAEGEVEDYIVDIRYEPCTSAKIPGHVDASAEALCPGYDYVLTDTSYEKQRSELIRTWLVSGDNITWLKADNNINRDTLLRIFNNQPLYYKIRQQCARSNDTAYSNIVAIKGKEGYKCYCYSEATGGYADTSDIGGFEIGQYTFNTGGPHVSNPVANKKRTDHTDEPPIILHLDSVYRITIFQTQPVAIHADAKVAVYIDLNNDQRYDVPGERVFLNYTSITNFTVSDTFKMPLTAVTGLLTGMRLIINNDVAPGDETCGAYVSGETHDYIVRLERAFPAGIQKNNAHVNDIMLLPNPSDGRFRLYFNCTDKIEHLSMTVTNMMGQQQYQRSYSDIKGVFNEEIDIRSIPSGVYQVNISYDAEGVNKKILIQH